MRALLVAFAAAVPVALIPLMLPAAWPPTLGIADRAVIVSIVVLAGAAVALPVAALAGHLTADEWTRRRGVAHTAYNAVMFGILQVLGAAMYALAFTLDPPQRQPIVALFLPFATCGVLGTMVWCSRKLTLPPAIVAFVASSVWGQVHQRLDAYEDTRISEAARLLAAEGHGRRR